jgi:hypothetical protein
VLAWLRDHPRCGLYLRRRLAALPWLAERRLFHWGDIDTHGFAILDRLRARLPDAASLLMDRETLLLHRPLWVEEAERHVGTLTRLTTPERALYDDLRADRLGQRVRLEQARVTFGGVAGVLEALTSRSSA